VKGVMKRIHQFLKLAFKEYITSEVIRSEIDLLGIDYKWPVTRTRVVATIGSGQKPFFGF